MRYATANAFRAALEERLKARAQETGVPLARLRKLVVFDRLMARLMAVAPHRWVLKGAVALQYRVGPQFRTTKDMDLGRQDDEESATSDFVAAQSVILDDYFTFVIERTARLEQLTEGAAVRYHATAQIAGRRFEDVTVDVGFGDSATEAPELLAGPDLLGFAEIPPTPIPTLPLEQHVAEKVHAYTRTYASGMASTRVKDLVDLVVIASRFTLQAGRLRRALDATFGSRDTHALPSALPTPPSEWGVPYRRAATEIGIDADVAVGFGEVKAFLNPVLDGTVPDDCRWNGHRQSWNNVSE